MLLLIQVKRLAERLNDALAKGSWRRACALVVRKRAESRACLLAAHWVENFAGNTTRLALPAFRPVGQIIPRRWGAEHAHGRMGRALRRRGQNRDLAGALWWHERWLPGVIARLEKAITCTRRVAAGLTRRSL